jgi:hypothetical protein
MLKVIRKHAFSASRGVACHSWHPWWVAALHALTVSCHAQIIYDALISVLDHPLPWTHLSNITKCVAYMQLLFAWRWCVCSWKCNMLLGSKRKQFMLHRLKVAGNSFWRKQMTLFGLRRDITHHSVIAPGKCSCNKCNCFTFCSTASSYSDFLWLLLN